MLHFESPRRKVRTATNIRSPTGVLRVNQALPQPCATPESKTLSMSEPRSRTPHALRLQSAETNGDASNTPEAEADNLVATPASHKASFGEPRSRTPRASMLQSPRSKSSTLGDDKCQVPTGGNDKCQAPTVGTPVASLFQSPTSKSSLQDEMHHRSPKSSTPKGQKENTPKSNTPKGKIAANELVSSPNRANATPPSRDLNTLVPHAQTPPEAMASSPKLQIKAEGSQCREGSDLFAQAVLD